MHMYRRLELTATYGVLAAFFLILFVSFAVAIMQ